MEALLLLRTPDEEIEPKLGEEPSFVVRYGAKGDYGFIFKTWMHSYRMHFSRRIDDRIFAEYHYSIIRPLLERAKIYVATVKEDETVILGYLVAQHNALHFMYVRPTFRRNGVGRELLKRCLSDTKTLMYYTYWTSAGERIVHKLKLRYNPFLV